LIWREFYIHILFHFPEVRKASFKPALRGLPWRSADAELEAWKHGQTGCPIVDAGMRQLRSTGWMHNRLRMITASYLVKDLLIDWREGERWFAHALIDYDLAANNGGWQWTAGTGTDSAPYFRIFNPVLQGKKFDPSGNYVRRWVPELVDLPDGFIHEPWKTPVRSRPSGYPAPLIDHNESRTRALAFYRDARRKNI
jgi:deoxyribodipyrimidine photo-lyase